MQINRKNLPKLIFYSAITCVSYGLAYAILGRRIAAPQRFRWAATSLSASLGTFTLYKGVRTLFPRTKPPVKKTNAKPIQVNISNPTSVIQFLEKRSSFNETHAGITENPSLVQNLFEQENYAEALKHVWSEKNQELKVDTLRQAAKLFHIPAMLELAAALEQEKPSEAYHWFALAFQCIRSDMACYQDTSVSSGDALMRIQLIYPTLNKEAAKIKRPALGYGIHQYLKSLNTLPSPRWLEGHGMASILRALGVAGQLSQSLKPEGEWSKCRKAVMGGPSHDDQ